MFTAPQSDPVTFWQPSFSLPNVIVVAGATAPIVPHLPAVCPRDAAFEMVHVTSPLEALALVERGRIAVVVLMDPDQGEGWTQVMVNGMARPKTPRFIIISSRVSEPYVQGWVRLHAPVNDPASFRNLVLAAVGEAQRPPDTGPVTPADFFRGAACFQEAAWIRVTADSGTGDLCFRDGGAVYAEAGRTSGRAAAAEILSWGPCRFEYRDFPAVLPSNVKQPLLELVGRRTAVPEPPPVGATAAWAMPADLDEPEFPTFDQGPEVGSYGIPAAAGESPGLDIEEPTEFSGDFDAGLQAIDMAGLALDAQSEEALNDLDAPPFPEFAESPPEPKISEPPPPPPPVEDFGFRSTIFLSVALIENGVMETCEPASSYADFDAAAIYHLFNGLERYMKAQSMGATNSLLVRATQTSLVVAGAPGTGKILAARLSGSRFGAAEEMELQRLMEKVTAPAAAR